MPGQHARLSPSGASRWLQCPASIRMKDKMPEPPDSPYAQEGTNAHALAELKARYHILGEMDADGYTAAHRAWLHQCGYDELADLDTLAEMDAHTDAYVKLLREELATMTNAVLLLEVRLENDLPQSWGRGDAVLVSADEIKVIDFKYGAGISVVAEGNPQLQLYGLGALAMFGSLLGEVQTVTMIVHQPRIGGTGHISRHTLAVDDLLAWQEQVRPIAEEALGPDARFGPSESACRFCAAAGRCAAQADQQLAIAQEEFGLGPDGDADSLEDPDLLSPEQVAKVLQLGPALEKWISAVRKAALEGAYSGERPVPGWKVVLRGGRRYVADPPGLVRALLDSGYEAEQVSDFKAKPFGQLEKLVGGRAAFDELCGKYVATGKPGPSLVPESAPGDSVNTLSQAQEEFGAVPTVSTSED